MKPALLYFLIILGTICLTCIIIVPWFWLKGKRPPRKVLPPTNAERIPIAGRSLYTSGNYIFSANGRVGVLYENSHKISDITLQEIPDRIAIAETDGSIAYTDTKGVLHINRNSDEKTINIEPGWMAKHVQWRENTLWFSAFKTDNSGSIMYYKDGNVEVGITGATPNDMFGFTFHINGDYIAVANMLQRSVHVLKLETLELLCIIQPQRELSMFPYALSVSNNGQYIYMGNPTETIGTRYEAGCVIKYDCVTKLFEDIHSEGTSWFGRSLQINKSDDVLIGDDLDSYLFEKNGSLHKQLGKASFMNNNRCAMIQDNFIKF